MVVTRWRKAPLLAAHSVGRMALPGESAWASHAGRPGCAHGTLAGIPVRVTSLRSMETARPVCWAMCEGQVSGPVSSKTSGGPGRKPIGVFVLEDQEIVRRGIRVLLEAEPDMR